MRISKLMYKIVLRYYHTLRYLKWEQVKFRIYYQIRQRLRPFTALLPTNTGTYATQELKLSDSVPVASLYHGNRTFCFLNITHHFEDGISWNYSGHGKLWTYNLTYFEYLSQTNLKKEEGLALIEDFIKNQVGIKDGLEPFPISLRIVFWLKFLTKHQIRRPEIDRSLYWQLRLLYAQLEYHLLGNHLLENGFGLLFGAFYFNEVGSYKKAEHLLTAQLNEQILADGGHFELSPMYHSLILYRLLDSINLLQHNSPPALSDFLGFLQQKAGLMLGWLQEIIFANGDLPHVNDSTDEVAPSSKALFDYAKSLGIASQRVNLQESGYRKYLTADYELLLDVGQIGPDYIPGHAHSDTFSFVLYHRGKPLVVDPGISTYEKNARRNLERSTAYHNTVMVDELDQSEVWGGFRVARRAEVIFLRESGGQIEAVHNGYQRIQAQHRRMFEMTPNAITITDEVNGGKKHLAFLHFAPAILPVLDGSRVTGPFGNIQFSEHAKISLVPYAFAKEFNQTLKAWKVIIEFSNHLQTKILLL